MIKIRNTKKYKYKTKADDRKKRPTKEEKHQKKKKSYLERLVKFNYYMTSLFMCIVCFYHGVL